MNKEIKAWAKKIRKSATKHPSWQLLISELQTELSQSGQTEFTFEQVEQALRYMFDLYDPNALASPESFADDTWKKPPFPNPFWSLTSIDETGEVEDVFIVDSDDIQKMTAFLMRDERKELQIDGLDKLWKSIKDVPPDQENLPYFIFFAYIMAVEEVEVKARKLLRQHPSFKKIDKIFQTNDAIYVFLQRLQKKCGIDITKIIQVIVTYDDAFPMKAQFWLNFCCNNKIPFASVPALFSMTEVSLDWGIVEKLELYEQLGNFSRLRKLSIYSYSRHVFPDPRMNLPTVEEIVIGGRLKKITTDVLHLHRLKDLSFGWMKLTKLPPEIFELPELLSLEINDNLLEQLPALKKTSPLKNLELALNKLTDLPQTFSFLSNLENLKLAHNLFQHVPVSLSSLKKLKKLDLTDNKLTELGPHIAALDNLEELCCYKNLIHHVHADITNLKRLKVLDLRFNPIAEEDVQWLREKLPQTRILHYSVPPQQTGRFA